MALTMRKRATDRCRVTLALVLLAGAALPQAVPAQSEVETLRRLRAVEDQRIAAIEAEVALNGPFSGDLYDMYFSLATHYLEREDHLRAADALEQALHIQRVTHGLFSLEQAPAIRALRSNSLAGGDFERVIELDSQLMRIARENSDDLRSAAIFHEAADRQMEVYGRYLAGELPATLSINMNFGGDRRPRIDQNRFIGMSNLYSARRNYFDAIDVLIASDLGADPRVVAIERKIIESYFLEASSDSIRPGRREGLFRLGRDSYMRMLRYAVDADDFSVAAEGMIGLADWHLLFQRFGSALEMYAEAHAALVSLGATPEVLDEIFAPAVPIALPAFNPNPLASAGAGADSADYLDVRMKLSRYGRSRARTIETSAAASDKLLEKRIRRIITRSRFRPMLVDGEPQHGREIEFRFYLDEKS